MSPKRFDRHTISQLDWKQYPGGADLKALLLPLVQEGTQAYIRNAANEMQVLALQDQLLPLIISNPQARANTYLASTVSQYFDLALEEIEMEMKGKGSFIATISTPILRLTQRLFRFLGFDRTVFINNWLLSTNLYPDMDLSQIPHIRDTLSQAFPQHALVFRSVNEVLDQGLYESLKTAGFRELISRPVLVMDPALRKYKKKRMYKMDQKLWQKNEKYHWEKVETLLPEELIRVRDLYNSLYIEKYSSLNPQYTEHFVDLLLQSKLMEFEVLKHDDKIQGVQALFKRRGLLTTPFIGYDQSLPLEEGVYRFLNLRLMEVAIEQGLVLNMSSGAAQFKRLRGGKTSIEYNMVYDRHLNPTARTPWGLYHAASHYVAIPTIKKYEL